MLGRQWAGTCTILEEWANVKRIKVIGKRGINGKICDKISNLKSSQKSNLIFKNTTSNVVFKEKMMKRESSFNLDLLEVSRISFFTLSLSWNHTILLPN
jgi:hypothetical protein